MELRYVIPNMEKTFGNLEFAGENKVEQRRINGRMTVPFPVASTFIRTYRGQMILSWCCLLLPVRRTLNQRKK